MHSTWAPGVWHLPECSVRLHAFIPHAVHLCWGPWLQPKERAKVVDNLLKYVHTDAACVRHEPGPMQQRQAQVSRGSTHPPPPHTHTPQRHGVPAVETPTCIDWV
jgi:hypothetical protein